MFDANPVWRATTWGMPSHAIREGDALSILHTLPSDHYHGSLTDPPYGLSFMGHGWDHGVPSADVWRELLRVLRPGAHVLAFGGTRTFHRLTCAIEDAGFEVRDCLMWLYGSGFPKSHDVGKAVPAFSGHGTALKPAWEPIILARKPIEGTVAQNVQRWGCGALAIDASRVGHSEPNGVRGGEQSTIASADPLGRWPANVILDEEAGLVLDAQTGTLHTHSGNVTKDMATVGFQGGGSGSERKITSNSGGASRFFYCAKASRKERDAGLEGFAVVTRAEQTRRKEGSAGSKNPAAGSGSTEGGRNVHPTVKPLALTTYLARLILPPIPDARMVVPFSGSGSEVIGALQAGWSHVDVAVRISRARIAHWASVLRRISATTSVGQFARSPFTRGFARGDRSRIEPETSHESMPAQFGLACYDLGHERHPFCPFVHFVGRSVQGRFRPLSKPGDVSR